MNVVWFCLICQHFSTIFSTWNMLFNTFFRWRLLLNECSQSFYGMRYGLIIRILYFLLNPIRSLLFQYIVYLLLWDRHSVFRWLPHLLYSYITRKSNIVTLNFLNSGKFVSIMLQSLVWLFRSVCINLAWWKQLLFVLSLTASHAASVWIIHYCQQSKS